MVSSQVLALAVSLFPLASWAKNDWSEACLSGQCDWDIPSGNGSSGTVRVLGSSHAVSDLTAAAGWTILDCDGDASDQDIRVACYNSSAGCDHLYENGAEYTVVRLPDDCAAMPFALVTREWEHENQDIPASKRSLLRRRDGTYPTVRGVTLATDFTSAKNVSQHGDVTFFVQGSSVEGVANDFVVPPNSDNTTIRQWIANTTLALNQLHKNVTAAQKRSLAPRVLEINATKHSFSYSTPETTLFDQSFDCPQVGDTPGFSAAVSLGAGGSIDGTVTFGFAFSGNIFDPDNFDFGLLVGLDSDINATLAMDAALTGSFAVKQTLYTVGLPGLNIPNILSIGPTFSVIGGAKVALDTAIDLGVDIVYNLAGAELVFPPMDVDDDNKNVTLLGGVFAPGDNAITLSATPNVTAHGNLTAHLIPQLAFGISALNGKASATVNLNVDASAGLSLSLDTGAVGDVSASTSDGTAASGAGDVEGCVGITTGLGITIGADADLFDVFNPNVSFPLFTGNWDLFQKCWATSGGGSTANKRRMATRRRSLLEAREAAPAVQARDVDWTGVLTDIGQGITQALACPASGFKNMTEVLVQTIEGSSLFNTLSNL